MESVHSVIKVVRLVMDHLTVIVLIVLRAITESMEDVSVLVPMAQWCYQAGSAAAPETAQPAQTKAQHVYHACQHQTHTYTRTNAFNNVLYKHTL